MTNDQLAEFENDNEHIPTEAEVLGIMNQVISQPYDVTRQYADKAGELYLLEVTVQGEEGDYDEYIYWRKGVYPQVHAKETEIQRASYKGGMFDSGTSIARLTDTGWKIL